MISVNTVLAGRPASLEDKRPRKAADRYGVDVSGMKKDVSLQKLWDGKKAIDHRMFSE